MRKQHQIAATSRTTKVIRVTGQDHARLKRMGKWKALHIKEVVGRLIDRAYERWMRRKKR